MDALFILVLVLLFLVGLVWVSNRPQNIPPGPTAYPIVGCLPFLRKFKSHRHKTLVKATEKYGDVISVWIGRQLFVFLHGYKTIQEAFVKQADVFSDRPNWLKTVQPLIRMGKGVTWNNGESWKILRKFTLQTLRDFGVGKSSLEDKIFIEIEDISNRFNDLDGAPTEIRHLMTMATTNILCGICFGTRYEYEDKDFLVLLTTLEAIFKGRGLLTPTNFMPTWIAVFIAPESKEELKQKEEIRKKIQGYIYNQIDQHQETFDPNNIRDFIDLYIKTANFTELTDQGVFTKGNIFRVINDLFVAGSETTATTLDWCFLFLAEYPDVQARCQEELEQNIGNRDVHLKDKGNLQYIEATLMEIQRLANIAAFSVPHQTCAKTSLNGHIIPKGTIVMANLYSAHMDPELFPEPDTFRPERFLNESGKILKSEALIPFSIGPRICPGESLAKMELFLVITNLLQRFNFLKEPNTSKHDFQSRTDQISQAPVPYKLSVQRRTM